MDYLLEYANRAIDYAWNTLGMRAVNRDEGMSHLPTGMTAPHLSREDVRRRSIDRLKRQRQMVRVKYSKQLNDHDYIFKRAELAPRIRVGACTEFSYIAFCYLYERGHRDIALIGSTRHDHMFVLLGGVINAKYYHFNTGILNIPISWRNAVICDPWYQESYRVVPDWYKKITEILYKTSKSGHELLGNNVSFQIETEYSPYYTRA